MENNEKKVSAEVTENTVKKEKKPMSKKKKTLVIILCILLAFFLFVGGFAIWYVNDKLNRIDYDTEQTTIAPNQEFVDDEKIEFAEMDDVTGNSFREILKNWATNGGEKMSNKNVLNVLLIGSDASATESGRASVTDKGNTDVMMLVSIDKANKKIKLVSFMRDSYTYMDQFDSYGKLNYDYETNTFTIYDISNYDKVYVNDLVYTSGYGSIKEKLLIGKVVKVDNSDISKKIVINSVVDFNNLNYVLIVGDNK